MTTTSTSAASRAVAVGAAFAVLALAGCGSARDLAVGATTAPTSEPTSGSTTGSTSGPTTAPPTSGSTSTPGTTGTVGGSLSPFYDQQVAWTSCGAAQCGTVTVPLDYANPGGDTVTLQLRKHPATSGHPVGTLFINPGGPGGSGLDFVDQFVGEAGASILENYDVVGFDPRGVGMSDPVTCLDTTQLDAFVAADPTPDNPAEVKTAEQLVQELGQGCEQRSGELAAHVSTIEVAKDLDIMRAAVGDDSLTYYGASYGTYIGANYAELFPDQVGRMVLDGALDPALSPQQTNLQQAGGFQGALDAYVADCLHRPDCPLPGPESAALGRIQSLLNGLDAKPLDTGDSARPLTEALGFYGVAVTLYNKDYWKYLDQGLQAAFNGDGSVLLTLADAYLSRGPSGYTDNSAEVISAVNCLDHPVQMSTAAIEKSIPAYTKVSPTFGRVFAWSMIGCAEWPIQPTQQPLKIDGQGAAPIVVVGTTRDPATPYAWAKALAGELRSGVFLSRDGDGHTGYGMGNSCIDDTINSYFTDGTVPPDGKSC